VVIEHFQTDSDYADILLPDNLPGAHRSVLAYGHYYLQMARPALPSPGETQPNTEIFRLLARQMGFTDACFSESDEI